MNYRLRLLFILPFLLLGCRAAQVANDHNAMREHLLDLYTEQLMDNLVRAHNGLPIVQIDYSNMVGQAQTQAGGSIGGSQTGTDSWTRAAGVAAAAISHSFVNVLNFSGSASKANTLSMTGTPITNNNDIYSAYLQFLEDPENLIVTTEPPPAGAAHLCKEYCGCYYWIPADRRGEFFKLSLVTTVMRGQPLKVPKDFDVVVDALAAKRTINEELQLYQVLFRVRSKLPNATGTAKLVILGVENQVVTNWIDQEQLDNLKFSEMKAPVIGKDSSLLLFTYSGLDIPLKPDELAKALEGKSIKVHVDGFSPPVPSLESMIEGIRNDQTLIRMQQTTLR